MFNDPSGSRSERFRLLDHIVKLIDCTPPTNPDGTRATIKYTFYSVTYRPVSEALVAAARRGVSVQVLMNSHADRSPTWRHLVEELGSDQTADSFAATCWQGCLRPRSPAVPDGPTGWFTAEAVSAVSRTVVFTDRSRAGRNPIVSWSWDFGDGTHADGSGPHRKTYASEGIFPTSLTVRDSSGAMHRTLGQVTVPDELEPPYPALHAKVFLSSTVGTGPTASRWVSAYGSGNPTYAQAREGFNNLNVSVGDTQVYAALDKYVSDLVSGSQGALLVTDYGRTVSTAGNAGAGSAPAVLHFMPRESGDLQLDVLRSITCRYSVGGQSRRTRVRVSMFAMSRPEIGAQLWRLAYERGCVVDILYTTLNQRIRGASGEWIPEGEGALAHWGPADCLAIPPTRQVLVASATGARTRIEEVPNTVDGPDGLCAGGTLDGQTAGTRGGTWIDRASPFTGGRLTVTAACPVEMRFDRMLGEWYLTCRQSRMFTHQKVLLVDGMIRGTVQKYVMTGTANWTQTGLRSNDDLVAEYWEAPRIHAAYLAARRHEMSALERSLASRALTNRETAQRAAAKHT
jgi:hypothetical protein